MSGGRRLGGVVFDHLITFRKRDPAHENFAGTETKPLSGAAEGLGAGTKFTCLR